MAPGVRRSTERHPKLTDRVTGPWTIGQLRQDLQRALRGVTPRHPVYCTKLTFT
jgi:hypothetical protein